MNLLTQALQSFKGEKIAGVDLQALAGDASTRRYLRVKSAEQTAILQLTEPFAGKNEFILVQEFLVSQGIGVPKILATEPTAGAVLLEDLGDTTMLAAIAANGTQAYEKKTYEAAIELLADFHKKADPAKYSGAKPAGFATAFDEEKLMWEVNFTLEHFFAGYLQKTFTAGERDQVVGTFAAICKELAQQPRVYTHRDYHSRNVMVDPNGALVTIDFQDARMGLRQYDLASILRDSYYQLEEAKVYAGVDYYCQKAGVPGGAEFSRIFDLMSVQRNFKALGTFGFQATQKKNYFYLRFVGNTFENIRRNLAKDSRYSTLARLLCAPYYS